MHVCTHADKQAQEFTCNSKGETTRNPKHNPTEQLAEKTRGVARQGQDLSPGGQARVAEFKVTPFKPLDASFKVKSSRLLVMIGLSYHKPQQTIV
jgi:hypothetical protein